MSAVLDQTNEINAISKSIKEIGENLEKNYTSKHEAKKLAEAVDALSKSMDKQRLVEKTNPVFGTHAAAVEFVDAMKGALEQSDVPAFRNFTKEANSQWYVNKDLNTYTSGSGSEFLPTSVSDLFSIMLAQGGVARREGTVITGVPGTINLNKRNGTSTAAFTAGGGSLKDDQAITPSVFGNAMLSLSPKQVGALSLISDKLLYGSAVNVAEIVAMDLIEQAAVLEDNSVIKGDGSTLTYGNITGINSDSDVPELSSTTSAFTNLDTLLDLQGQVHESVYDSETAAYYISGKILTKIKQMKASTAGVYFLDPTTGQFMLGGRPVKVWHRMDNTVANGKYVAYFGDMKKALQIATGREMRLEVSRDYKFNTVQQAWRLVYDFDAGLLQPTAIARYKLTS